MFCSMKWRVCLYIQSAGSSEAAHKPFTTNSTTGQKSKGIRLMACVNSDKNKRGQTSSLTKRFLCLPFLQSGALMPPRLAHDHCLQLGPELHTRESKQATST